MKVRRGDVVLVDYPYSDRTGSKIRPCLIVQADHNNQRLDDTIVVTISSRSPQANEPTQLLVDLATPVGQQSGLLFTSVIQCTNILTVDCNFILRKIGTLPADSMQRVNDCLKAALEIA
jgi:mRNA interferase MazF